MPELPSEVRAASVAIAKGRYDRLIRVSTLQTECLRHDGSPQASLAL